MQRRANINPAHHDVCRFCADTSACTRAGAGHAVCSHQAGHAGIDDIGDRIGVVTHMRPVTVLLGRIGNRQIQQQVIGRRIAQMQVDAVTGVRSSSPQAPEPAACRHGYAWRNPLLYRLQSRVQ